MFMFHDKIETAKIFGRLYPGENSRKQYQNYQMKKQKIMLAMIVLGMVSAVCLHLSSRMQSRLSEGACLNREEWDGESYAVILSAQTEAGEELVEVEVLQRKLSDGEISKLKDEAVKVLPTVILGNNKELSAVREDLNLITELQDYPFSIAWKSSNYNYIEPNGKVKNTEITEAGEKVILTAVLGYCKEKWEEEICVTVMPDILTKEEQERSRLLQLIAEKDEFYKESPVLVLPGEIEDRLIHWKEKKTDDSFWLFLLGMVGSMFTGFSMDQSLKKKMKIREKDLIRSYPEFVSKLQLYMGAGMTVKNIFLKLGRDYQKEKERTKKVRYIYEEILISNYQFLNGKSEEEVYREWGKRCEVMSYRKLAFLLTSHLRQGNDKILTLLTGEMYHAMEESKNKAKKQGEEAETKMLFPMIMMLVIVMVLILLPAFIKLAG